MSFSKNDLDKIKAKIPISTELEKKSKLIKKGKDFWCCCPFHEEKTPSCKINDDQGSFYCFGCGAKGDIFTIYTDLYNYNFLDAVKELSERAGIQISFQTTQKSQQENKIEIILKHACEWFQSNLNLPASKKCKQYLQNRNLSQEIIYEFKLGYSYNPSSSLYEFLKNKLFKDEDLFKSNVIKLDKNNNIRDYFYKRLIFPITNERGTVVGFGGRVLDNSNPKYINSPESNFFQKRYLLYNLNLAKSVARKKNNLLICEGYMDVISLYKNGIKSVVAPLGTALTEDQLNLAWKYSSKPTIMFDGDGAGIRASYKSAIMGLPLITAKKFLQFITLPEDKDPDSFINTISLEKFIELLKDPQNLVDFIFFQSSKSVHLNNADEKISYDKYLDELILKIKDKKIQFFYKNEFKTLFFDKIRKSRIFPQNKKKPLKKINSSIQEKQLFSFIATGINHMSVRQNIYEELLKNELMISHKKFIKELKFESNIELKSKELLNKLTHTEYKRAILSCLNVKNYTLFPYSSPLFDPQLAYQEVKKSIKNLNTRLSNLKKINKSLDDFINNSNSLNWNELQKINIEVLEED